MQAQRPLLQLMQPQATWAKVTRKLSCFGGFTIRLVLEQRYNGG